MTKATWTAAKKRRRRRQPGYSENQHRRKPKSSAVSAACRDVTGVFQACCKTVSLLVTRQLCSPVQLEEFAIHLQSCGGARLVECDWLHHAQQHLCCSLSAVLQWRRAALESGLSHKDQKRKAPDDNVSAIAAAADGPKLKGGRFDTLGNVSSDDSSDSQ